MGSRQMSPNTRTRRVDQFFPSKKKQCLSPYGKLGRTNKDVACLECSPNAKGSLDGYLVKSLDGISLLNKTSSDQGALKREDTVKQNLSFGVSQPPTSVLDIPLESDFMLQPCCTYSQAVFSSPVKSLIKGQANTVEHVQEEHAGTVFLESNANESEKSFHSLGAELNSEAKDLSVSFLPDQNTSIYHGSVNQELSQFANSFLRICGSELVATETLPMEGHLMSPKLNKTKRSASPSHLAATSSALKKKACGTESGYHPMERLVEEPCIHQECSEDYARDPADRSHGMDSSEFHSLPVDGLCVGNGSKEISIRGCESNGEFLIQSTRKDCTDLLVPKISISASSLMQSSESISGLDAKDKMYSLAGTETPEILRKCCRTPRNSLEQICLTTPSGAVIKGCMNKTPGWIYCNSAISPGDEFWDEAIQLADGLIAVKTDTFSIEGDCETCLAINVQDHQGKLSSSKTGSCAVAVCSEAVMSYDLKFQNSGSDIFSSKRLQQPFTSKLEDEHTEHEVPNESVACLEVSVPGECITKHGREKSYIGRVVQSKTFGVESSPLRVQHFDFLCEENAVIEQNMGELPIQYTENVPCKSHLPVCPKSCMAVGSTLKQSDTCSDFPNECLGREDSQMHNVALKQSQNAVDIEAYRINESVDVDALKIKSANNDISISDSRIVPSTGNEASNNKHSPLLTCHDSIILSLKPVPGFYSETLKDAENSMATNKNVTLSKEHVDLIVDAFGRKIPDSTGTEVNNKRSTQDDGVQTPRSAPLKDCLELSAWLPQKICNVYAKKGITKLYPWQVECLQLDGVLQRRNLVYCASTSAGKSLVAEILLMRRVISTGRRALLVLPYVSLCAEKAEHLEKLLDPLNKRVRSFYGSHGSGTLPKETSVAVCTIEKANSLINRLLEEGRLAEVGIIVIDELHMVGDQSRGYLLELMLTKLRYASGEGDSGTSDGDSPGLRSGKTDPAAGMQIVGMSATMPNVGAVASWLQAALYETEFRPVPLDEYVKVGNVVYNKNMEVVRTIRKDAILGGKDPEHVVELCNEVVQEGHSVLLFCSSRKACETTARHVAKFLKEFSIRKQDQGDEIKDAFTAADELRKCPGGLDPTLGETLPSGVAYHHAGLTVEEREIVETYYRLGIVRVLTATSTLAAGVNLPARRVIFRQPRIGRDFLDGTRYRQMAGRAGRTGIDTKGESILICRPEEVKRVVTMLNASCPPLQSCLAEDKNGMTRAILEVVAGGIVQTANDVHRYVRCTLLNSTQPFQEVVKSAQDSLRWLCHAKFLEWDEQTQMYTTTPLGRAAFGSSLSPEESLIVLEDLARAREGFVLASDLHLLYQVTPINVDVEPDWEIFYERFMELCVLDKSVGNRVGVVEPFLMRMAHGAPTVPLRSKVLRNGKSPKDKSLSRSSTCTRSNNSALSTEQTLRVCRRFYVALMLARLVQEVPLMDVCEAFKVPRGMVQALQESAGRFASMVSAFCERLGWHDLEGLISKFQNRVSFGVRAEIAELTSIPFVKAARARALYKAGLRTPQAVAEASLSELIKALFEASSWAAQDGSRSALQQKVQFGVAKKIKNGARQIVLDQAESARLAAFSAFRALGLNVPIDISQPLQGKSLAVDQNQDDNEVVFPSKMIVETAADSDTSNGKVLPDVSSVLPDTDIQSIFKVADTEDIMTTTKQKGKDGDSILIVGSEGATRDAVGRVKYQVSKNLSNEEGNEGVVGKDSVHIHGLKVEEEYSKAIGDASGSENSLVPKKYEKSVSIIADATAMFSGLIVEKEINQGKQKISESAHISIQGPIDVNNATDGFDSFLKLWDTVKEFFFDLHFSKANTHDPSSVIFEVHGLAVCWENSPVYYVNICTNIEKKGLILQKDDKNVVNTNEEAAYLKEKWDVIKERWKSIAKIMHQKGTKKVTWDLKRQIKALKKPGIYMPTALQTADKTSEDNVEAHLNGNLLMLLPSMDVGEAIDMRLVTWILWPDEESTDNPTLEQEVKKRLTGEAAAAANRDGRWTNQMGRVAHNGCCRRAAQVRSLHNILWKVVLSEGLDQAVTSLEIPLVKVLADMENWGIGIDMEACRRARCILERKLKELEDKAYKLAGMKFSLSTPADVANVLYCQLDLPVPENYNKGKQHPSTDKHSLDLLRHRHPIVAVIKEYRTLAKLLQSTLNSILFWARLYGSSEIYCIHGQWLQTSTATGRLSMEEPNLQHVEHRVDFTLETSNGIGIDATRPEQYKINPRDIFVPTQEKWLLMSADYSQIELRLMAHFSKDVSLISLLRRPDGDLFIMMAARWTGQDEAAITEKQREQTKKLVYGILYGMGVNTLADQLECSVAEAAERHERFKSAFPGVSSWLQDTVDCCRQRGYIRTLSRRKRYLGKINFGNRGEQAKAERQAVNSICQGSAADIIKMAMLKVYSAIAGESETSSLEEKSDPCEKSDCKFSMLKGHCRLLLQIHDELLLEVDHLMVREAAALVRSRMEEAASLQVPLRVKLQVGRTWGSLEPFNEMK